MAKNNDNLHSAKKAKNDEFYTQLSDIEKELQHYREHFNGKVVFCNCNDALHSNFAKYFSLNFEFLGLKKLICTAYKVDGEHGKVCFYYGDKNGNNVPDLDEWECQMLEGDGGYSSPECLELLKEADIVVTNPPFSLFRDYVKTLMEYGKKFLIIGNINAVTYKEIFPLIKNNEMWLGPSITSGDRRFDVPESYPLEAAGCGIDKDGIRFIRVKGIRWLTNLEHNKRHESLDLYKRYLNKSEGEYPKYDNYDAIEVSKTCDIPMDYDGVMGVPITFLDKYCPEQFEIVGMMSGVKDPVFANGNDGRAKFYVNDKGVYARILIKRIK